MRLSCRRCRRTGESGIGRLAHRIAQRSGLLAVGLLALPIAGTRPAQAQLIDAWSLDSGIRFDRALPSARLQALGGMREAVADENNEINLNDFGDNLVGHLDDKPTGHAEAYTGPRSWFDRTRPNTRDQEFDVFPTSVSINLLPGNRYAVGGTADYTKGSGKRLVSRDLRHRFTLPVENSAVGSQDGLLLDSNLRSPASTAYYVRRFGKVGAGLEGGYTKEEEDRRPISVYKINHESTTWSAKGSLAAKILDNERLHNWVLGANGRVAKTKLLGLSADELHNDLFHWDRPSIGFQIHLLGQVGAVTKGGLDFRYDSFEGQETVDMNWSPQFELNPTEATIKIHRSAFEEGFRSSQFRTRWTMEPRGRPIVLGAGFQAGQQELWQFAAENMNSFMTSKVERFTDWQGTGGGTYYLPRGRGLLAAEMAYGWADRDDRVSAPAVRVGASTFEIGAGAEVAVALPAVARAGYRLILDDRNRDRDDPESEFTTHRLAVGAGYRTPDAKVLLDLGFAYDFVESGSEKNAVPNGVEGQDRKVLTLQVRSVF